MSCVPYSSPIRPPWECRTLLSVSAAEIAAALDVAPSGWSLTVRRAHERMQNDAEFAHAVVELRERLGRQTWTGVRWMIAEPI